MHIITEVLSCIYIFENNNKNNVTRSISKKTGRLQGLPSSKKMAQPKIDFSIDLFSVLVVVSFLFEKIFFE